jgi:hypothetical protein
MVQLIAVVGFLVIMLDAFVRGRDKYNAFCVGLSLPVFMFILLPVSFITTWLCPDTVDSMLRRGDLFLHMDGFALTRWMLRTHMQQFFVVPIYSGLPFVMALAWITGESKTLLRAVVIGAVLAIPFYLLVPAVGPEYAFVNFPETYAHAIIPVLHPRNCFPSMHFCWSLLLVLNIKGWRRGLFLAYATAMAFATVSAGEHYFIDVLAAIPFAFAVQYLASHVLTEQVVVRALAFKFASQVEKR